MTLDQLQFIFNRAAFRTFEKTKILLTFAVLVLCGVMAVFFRGVAVDATQWLALSLTFLPIFVSGGILLSLGILLIRVYHDEIKERQIIYKDILNKSWEVVIGASYFSVPVILCYLLLWMLLGIFVLLSEIPTLGAFFSVVLAFGPFLLNLGSILLIIFSFAMLFYVAPILALKGFNRIQVSRILVKRFKNDIFSNLLLLLVALLPLGMVMGTLTIAAFLTGTLTYAYATPVHTVLVWFFTMIPYTALMSPFVVFFFNFAAEAHVMIMKKQKEKVSIQ